jgi:hypothetical protein
MRTKFMVFLLLMLAMTAVPAMADHIPYSPIGTVAPTDVFTAIATGSVTGYFYGSSADDDDKVQMCDVTQGYCSSFALDNHASAVGASQNFGSVTQGDILVFNLDNLATGYILSSNPSGSPDGLNHAYGTAYTGGVPGIPAGTFVGMEDLLRSAPSDFDYNDDEFVFTNVAIATPEPASVFMLAIGILGLWGMKRRQVS